MNQIPAFPLGRIVGAQTTDDGKHMLLQTLQANGQETVLAVNRDQLMPLIDLTALSFTQSNKILDVPTEQKAAFNVTWWEIGFDPTTNNVVLSLTF